MNRIIKSKLGVTYPVIMTFSICLAILTISRLLLIMWQWDRVCDANGFFKLIVSGLRIDVSSLCYLFILPGLLSSILSSETIIGKFWKYILRIWITISIWFIVYMEAATIPFILEYDLRPNRLFIEYLIYPKEVMAMLWGGYKLELFFGIILTIISIIIGWKISRKMTSNATYQKWYWRPVLAVIIVTVGIIGARSSFGHRPLNPALVAFSTDPLINDLTLNSAYSVLFAYKQMRAEVDASKYYPKMDKADIISEVRNSMNVSPEHFVSKIQPSMAIHRAIEQDSKKNIVILLLESHGARYISELGGINLSPNINVLINEGWAFTRLYASGTRSVRGIEAVISGFSPTPARSTVKLAKSQNGFFTIADLLQKNGYHTQFIYGGESHFDNMKSFFLGNGFKDIQDLSTFDNPKFIGSWGASDEDLYAHADKQFTQLANDGKPFFSLVFSSSNHSPFEYPDNKIEQYNTPKKTVENAVKYADYSLGQFIQKAKKSNYWENTIFVAVADHDARTWGNQVIPIEHFHIPAIIFGDGIKVKKDNRLVSQLDLAPTLLSLAGLDTTNPMLGHDLTLDVPKEKQRAMMQRDKTFAWMTEDNNVVVFLPGQPIQTYKYDYKNNHLIKSKVSDAVIKRANANALWGSLAYKENYYKQLESYQLN
ncbi:LTA synthase family protein [Aliivibrio sp. S2TY2]|uniref:LTA synthase family protein n=1 Tax=unclassified Aliivibrio TaxID=2645654 RepID=UPI002379E5E5|nr:MULTISPECIES: LTA synthase family protein [unclassified Aliivibrio]MDD9173496.1 LTA synthase family protein [Aliivibrio sp. S3TY1]MDD9190572.1 LTA synthase family protein [Aliivibrio sp. S2TY2]